MNVWQRGCLFALVLGSSVGSVGAAELWFGRNLGWKVGSDSRYPDRVDGGYYTPFYKHGGERCFGYHPAYFPGKFPGVYGGYEHFRKGSSGCDINAKQPIEK